MLDDPTYQAEAIEDGLTEEEQEAEKLRREQEAREREAERRFILDRYQRFRNAQMARGTKEELWATLDQFDRSEQWKNANIPPWVPKPITNFIRYYRTLKRANLTTALSRPTFEPVTQEDEEIVKRLQQAHDHVWDFEHIPRVIRRAINWGILFGTSIVQVYSDETYIGGKYYPPQVDPMTGQPIPDSRNSLYQGKVCVKRISIGNFFPDPDAYRIEDCKFIEVTENLPLNSILNNPIFRQYAGDKLNMIKSSEMEQEHSATGEIFDRDTYPSDNISSNLPGDEMVTLHTHWERYLGEDGRWHLDVTYYLRDHDFILYQITDVQPNEYPFAVFYDEEEENEFWGRSICMDLLESQKVVNKVQQVAAVIGSLHQNPQKVLLRESGINAQDLARAGTLPGKVWMSNVPNPIEILQQPDIPRGLFELDERSMASMREMAGITESYMGASVGSLTTSTGVESLIERATIRDRDKMVQIDEFIERISHLIVLHILHKWNSKRPIPTVNPDGSMNYAMYEPVEPLTAENLEWRVRSNIYAKAPTTQATKRQQADQLLQIQGQFQFQPAVITPEEYIKQYEFPDGEKILARIQADRQRMLQQQQMDMVQMIISLGMQAGQLGQQGMPPEQVAQMLMPMVQQMMAPQQGMGQPPGEGQQRPSAPAQPTPPQGVTSQVAMANMARGF